MRSEVLREMGYPAWYMEKYITFFGEIFTDKDELESFFRKTFKYDGKIKEPRRILNQIQQLMKWNYNENRKLH